MNLFNYHSSCISLFYYFYCIINSQYRDQPHFNIYIILMNFSVNTFSRPTKVVLSCPV